MGPRRLESPVSPCYRSPSPRSCALAAEHRIGGGFNYWRTIDDIDLDFFDDIDDDGLALIGSYQYVPAGIFRLEVALEYFDEGFGGSPDSAFSPQAYVLVGKGIYAGLGLGITYSNGFEDDLSDPFFAARGGFDMTLLPGVHLDLNANYRFDAWSELDEASTDAIFLGAQVRVAF